MVIKIKTSAGRHAATAKAAQDNVEFAAMKAGEGWHGLIHVVKAALGEVNPKSEAPEDKALFARTRHSFQSGHMAHALFASSNLPQAERLAKAREARDAADGEGKGNLRTGQSRRRTTAEQAAYNSAKTAWSRLLSDAGLKSIETRGGNVTPKAPVKAPVTTPDKSATVPAAVAAKYMPPKSADRETAVAYVRQQIKLLSTFITASNQRLMKTSDETLPVALCSAIKDCSVALDAVK